jgi:hypothetical protein
MVRHSQIGKHYFGGMGAFEVAGDYSKVSTNGDSAKIDCFTGMLKFNGKEESYDCRSDCSWSAGSRSTGNYCLP